MPRTKTAPVLELLITTAIWGLNGLIVKGYALSPLTFSFFRMGLPALVLGFYFIFIRRTLPGAGQNPGPVLLASFLNALRLVLYFTAMTLTSVGNAIIILYTWPLFTSLFEGIFLKERLDPLIKKLLPVAFAGMILVFVDKPLSFADQDFLGMSLMLLSSAIFSLSIIIFKKASPRYTPAETIFYQNSIGALLTIPLGLLWAPFPSLGTSAVLTVFFLAGGLGGFLLFFRALKVLPASTVSFLTYLEVFFTLLFSLLFLNESLTWNMLAGAILILTPKVVFLVKR
ncbi:MAG: EamA/RhaT family transporter [Spirochaetae bacterium HGW-Spirochaetae-6]|nr:MAG: EamA/RhaT family transporter [Spirochaetae bacterium HGW-Spirochaetae-6]